MTTMANGEMRKNVRIYKKKADDVGGEKLHFVIAYNTQC